MLSAEPLRWRGAPTTKRKGQLNHQQEEGPRVKTVQEALLARPVHHGPAVVGVAEEVQARRSEAARRAVGVRLACEDPKAMTAAAVASGRHVGSLERWKQAARELAPGASNDELERLGAELRSAHFSEMGRRSAAVRRPADGKPGRGRPAADPDRWEKTAREQNPAATDEEITQIAEALRGACGAAARNSPMWIHSPQRWTILAREQAPRASEQETARLAAELRAEHYAKAARTRAERRARKRENAQ